MVRPIGNQPPSGPWDHGQFHNPLITKMKNMIVEFRSLLCSEEFCPSSQNTKRLVEFTYHLRSFLEEHKEEIFADAKKQGWPPMSESMNDGYEGIYDALMIGVNTILNPETRGIGSLEFVNEQLTQLTWLIETPSKKH